MNDYDKNLDKNKANYVPLTPISFIERTKDIYPNYEALVYKKRSYTWKQVYDRSIKFASALEKHGIKLGDTVSIMAANTPELFEAHYSVPMTGAVLNAINTRLDAKTVGYILKHADAKALIVDRQFHGVVKKVLESFGKKILIIDIVKYFLIIKQIKLLGLIMEVKLFLKLFILFIKNKFINLNEKLNLESVLLTGAFNLNLFN